MDNLERNHIIKESLDRLIEVYEQRPGFARSSPSITGTIEDGVLCRISDGQHNVVSDLPEAMGGSEEGPTPGFFARAGIAGCVSMGVKMMAARAGHNFRKVSVTVETDFDDRGTFGLCAVSAAPLETRVTINVESDLSEEEAAAFVLDVLERDPWFLGLRDAQSVKTTINAGLTTDAGA